MSACRLMHSAPRTCHSETEFRNLFERHSKTLLEQKWQMIAEINEWGNNLVRQVEETLTRQKRLLEREYQNQLHHLRIKHQEYLETALVYEEREHREEVRQLLEQCHALQFDIASIEYPEQSVLFIQIQEGQNSLDRHQSDKSPTVGDDLSCKDYSSVDANATSTLTLPSSKFSGDPADTEEKCPACFIVFPSTMKTDERSHHVNRHFEDS